jgi:Bacterial mobilisation protein (MobC)
VRDRAAARGMAPATFVSVLVRSHLRNLAPLPKEELLALKRSVAELGAIGRNLNQIARAVNQGGKPSGPDREDLWAMLRLAEGLRDHVKALLKANQRSWHQGHAGDSMKWREFSAG